MIGKLSCGQFRLRPGKNNPRSGKGRRLGAFSTLEHAKQHQREAQIFKRHNLGRRGLDMPRSKKTSGKNNKTNRWSSQVKTVSTFPPPALFTKDAQTIARALASKKVSPKGPGSGMRMLTFYVNRAGKNLDKGRRAELQKAKELLSERVHAARGQRPKRAA